MKYLLFDPPPHAACPFPFPVLFGAEDHAKVAKLFTDAGYKLVSAGFVQAKADGGYECAGYSHSLNIYSRGQKDAEIIEAVTRAIITTAGHNAGRLYAPPATTAEPLTA